MTAARTITAEILDDLPPEDPRAQGSRRDLRRINRLMRNARVVACLVGGRSLGRVLEIGAGDGAFMRSLLPRLRPEGQAKAVLLDRQPLSVQGQEAAFARYGWRVETVAADAFDYLASSDAGAYDAIVANLFLHHFEDDRLAELLGLAAGRTDLFVACEPRRSRLALAGTHALGAIGCNAVTRHDARVSVLAGFQDCELSGLWPEGGEWRLEERPAAPFGHAFRAERGR